MVHRPGHDDWGFPKGKLEPGETAEQAALREVEEETGFECELVRPAGKVRYIDRQGRPKVVFYWVMRPVKGDFVANEEIDELRWLAVEEAEQLLTYKDDHAILRAIL